MGAREHATVNLREGESYIKVARRPRAAKQPAPPAVARLLYRVNEVAEVLGYSRSTVYELLKSGALPSVGYGRSRRVRSMDLEAFVVALQAKEV
jgi:excisionase family DNA binding protein